MSTIVEGEGCLGDVSEIFGVWWRGEVACVLNIFDDVHEVLGDSSCGSDGFRMGFMADEEEEGIVFDPSFCFFMDFGDEGASGVDDEEVSFFGFIDDGLRDAVSGEDDGLRGIGDGGEFFDEDGAHGFES